MEPLVTEIMRLIDGGADDPRLRWSADRQTVRVVYSRMVLDGPPRVDPEGRRASFADEWRAAMAEHGWRPAGTPGVFTRATRRGAASIRPATARPQM
jgi:hypothetical protein